MNKKYLKVGIMVALMTVGFVGISMMLNQNNAVVSLDVSLVFEDQVSADFLDRIGANVKYTYQTFAAVSAFIPSNMLDVVINSPLIKTWEYNFPIQISEDSTDWGVDRIDADVVWGGTDGAVDVTTSVSGSGAKVAVIDTGIDYNHPDLAPNYAGGYDFYNDDADPLDDHGHGTHVSGTIAAADDEPNALDGSLIGTAPDAQIYSLKVCSDQGSCPSDAIAAALDWSANNGMDVASLSLGGSYSSVTDAAGQRAYEAGVLLVAASGNDGASSVSYPAANEEFIAVGATDQNDQLASFSNYGSAQEMTAPGVDITSTTPTYSLGGGPFAPAQNYDTWDGTSMATPHVSGVGALVASADSSLTNVEIRQILQDSAEDLGTSGWDEQYGYGLVDAEAAVNLAGGGGSGDTTPPAKVTGLTATAVSSSQIDLNWDDNTESDLSHYNVYRDGAFIAQTSSSSYSDTGLSADTTYTYEVSAVDTSGNEGTKSDPASATTDPASSTGTMYVSDVTVTNPRNRGPWRDIQVTVDVVDGDGNPLEGVTVSVQLDTPGGNTYNTDAVTDSNGRVSIYYDKADRTSGTYTATVTNLAKSGYTYDSASNVETSDSIVA